MHGRVRPAHRHRPQRIRRPLPDVSVHDGVRVMEAIRQAMQQRAAAHQRRWAAAVRADVYFLPLGWPGSLHMVMPSKPAAPRTWKISSRRAIGSAVPAANSG